MQQAFPVFEGARRGRVHTPVEYIQIKELAKSVRNYGVSANFTIAQVERLAASAMTPGDWTTVVKAVVPNMGMYLEWKALWQDFCQTQARANATMEGDQRTWTFELLTGQGQHAANQIIIGEHTLRSQLPLLRHGRHSLRRERQVGI